MNLYQGTYGLRLSADSGLDPSMVADALRAAIFWEAEDSDGTMWAALKLGGSRSVELGEGVELINEAGMSLAGDYVSQPGWHTLGSNEAQLEALKHDANGQSNASYWIVAAGLALLLLTFGLVKKKR